MFFFCIKTLTYGSLDKKKSCVGAKGYNQTLVFDFSEIFNLMVKQVTI